MKLIIMCPKCKKNDKIKVSGPVLYCNRCNVWLKHDILEKFYHDGMKYGRNEFIKEINQELNILFKKFKINIKL